ncbi:nucleotidyltransferase family protein [Xanthocytophaga agilis]|uniref:Nucleotidyltransferase family protein n=1 Tax=Xanthocytophaga agilis TaxID=3048010 RepID=A0AAE3QXW3_9BACT|nr:nucleotidyltransferase family protein [Xanthocytophaga agilis]MDJ1500081.1 nucleotidyltransferase family protein [Xanthocytophaga agilis]
MIGILLLAAGASTRLGQPKQLLQFQGQSLIERSIQTILALDVTERVVVLGAHANEISSEIASLPIETIINHNWDEGMASSIRMGVNYMLQKKPNLEAIVLMLCDQPFVTPDLLNQLIQIYEQTAAPIVASSYQDVLGVPALFAHGTFYKLLALKGDKGARSIIPDYQELLQFVSFPKGGIDIDTIEDYEKWLVAPQQSPGIY